MDEIVFVIIPTFNPGEIIKQVVIKTLKFTNNIIIVDDGCDEVNKSILQDIAHNHKITILTHVENKGKGFAIQTGIEYALKNKAKSIVLIDSDGQHNPEELQDFLEFSNNNSYHLVVGVRSDIDKMPLRSKIGNISMAWMFRLLYGQKLKDTQSGYRMLSAEFAQLFLDNVEAGRYETEMKMLMMAAKNNIKIDQIPIDTQYFDDNANSKFRPIADSLRVLGSFAKYSGVGFLSFLIDYAIFLVLVFIFPTYFIVAHISSRICSGVFNFIVNKNYVFNNNQNYAKPLIKYLMAVVVSLALSTFLLYVFVEMVLFKTAIAKICAEASTFILNYYVLKNFVFKKP